MKSYLNEATTIRSWLLTLDHKRIGVMFLIATTVMMALGGALALVLRLEHLTPTKTLVEPLTYNRLFTMHGVIMVFFFMIPAIPSGFGNFVLPMMIGARDVAFPRLNLASFYLYLAGGALALGGMLWGGADTGWTFYAPYSTTSPTAVVPVVAGVFVAGLSSIATGVNFIVTVHTMRAKGLAFGGLPLFVWNIYGTSVIQVLATPVLGLSLVVVGLDHAFDWGVFDTARGGDPLLFQHLFWFYSHPAVYIMILPAMGVITEVVCTFAHKNPTSYVALVVATLGIAFVGFLTWGHHLFVAGMSSFDAVFFGFFSMLVAIFSAVKVFTWVGTLYKGAIAMTTPMLYVMVFLFLFVFGGMTGVAVATMSLDVHWHDTYFVVAHFHFIMVGGTLSGFLAAVHYWFPKITGRRYSEKWGLLAAALIFAGFNMTFVPQFLLGNAGMPRRYYDYPEQYAVLHLISTVGSWALAGGMLTTLAYLVAALVRGKPASANPWSSACFEWRTASPPPVHNFAAPPVFTVGAYDYVQQVDSHPAALPAE